MKCLKAIGNFLIAATLIVATTGMTLHKHYCLGQLKSIEINHRAQSCGDAMGMEDNKGSLNPCCEEVAQELKIDDLTQSSFTFDANTSLFIIDWYTFPDFSRDLVKEESGYAYIDTSPPLLYKNIPILIQSFLI